MSFTKIIAKEPNVIFEVHLEDLSIIKTTLLLSNDGFKCHLIQQGTDNSLAELILLWMEAYAKGQDPIVVLPLYQGELSPFTWRVLSHIKQIPLAETASYKDIAKGIGNENASRAVGNACRVNPFPLVIPCHRVIQTNGGLGGFALDKKIKERLLDFERKF